MRILGAILGAIVAPVILVALVMLVYPRITSDNWDFATPVLTIGAATLACAFGAVAGALIAGAVQSGDLHRAGAMAALALVLLAVFPGWLAWQWYGPERRVDPTSHAEREQWARDRQAFHREHGFSEVPGLSLAWQLRVCFRGSGCESLQWRRYGQGEDTIAAHGEAYRVGDDGWRWDSDDGPPRRTLVFPDPRLGLTGPVFEVHTYDIFRRETRDAPAFSTDTVLALLLSLPNCVTRFAATARADGSWDGSPPTLAAVMAERWSPGEGCPGLAVYTRPETTSEPWEFVIREGTAVHSRFQIHADPSVSDAPFRFVFMHDGRGFMREANGGWHVRPGAIPYEGDPAPPACLFDLTVPCE